MRLATKTDDVVQVIDKAEDILAGATKGSKGFANLDEFDTLKGSKVEEINTVKIFKRSSKDKGIELKGDYSVEYTNKLQSTYKIFKAKNYELSEHSLNRIMGRINQGQIGSINDVLDALESGTKYIDTMNGGIVMFKDGISIHIAEDGIIKTVIGNAKVKSTWEVIE